VHGDAHTLAKKLERFLIAIDDESEL